MSPEQAQGNSQEITPRSDVFSLGVIFYELLTGVLPFHGDTVATTIYQVVHETPTAPRSLEPNLPAKLEAICLKCLNKDPQDRYACAGDLALDLQRYLNRKSMWRLWAEVGLVAALLIMTMFLLLGVDWQSQHKLAQIQVHLEKVIDENQTLTREISQLRREVIPELKGNLKVTNESLKEKEAKLVSLEKSIPVLKDKNAELIKQVKTLDSLLQQTQGQIVKLKNERAIDRARLKQFEEKTIPELKIQAAKEKQKLLDAIKELNETKIPALTKKYKGVVELNNELFAKLSFANKKIIPDLETKNTKLTKQISERDSQLKSAQTRIPQLVKERDAAQTRYTQLEKTFPEREAKLKKEHRTQLDAITKLHEKTTSELKSQIAMLTKQVSERDSQLQTARANLKEIEKKAKAQAAFRNAGKALARTPQYQQRMSGKQVGKKYTWQGHSDRVTSLVFSPTKKQVLSGSLDKTIRLWDLDQKKEIQCFKGHKSGVLSVALSPDEKYVLSGSRDKSARLWDVQTGKLIWQFPHKDKVLCVEFTNMGKEVFTVSQDGLARILDRATGKQKFIVSGLFRKSRRGLEIFSARIPPKKMGLNAIVSPNGQRILAADFGKLQLWDVKSNKLIAETTARGITSMAFSPDGTRILTGDSSSTVKLFDSESLKELAQFYGHNGSVMQTQFSADGKYGFSGGTDGILYLWDFQAKEDRHRWVLGGGPSGRERPDEIAFSPNGNWICYSNWSTYANELTFSFRELK